MTTSPKGSQHTEEADNSADYPQSTTESTPPVCIDITIPVPATRLADLMVGALEGASNYWIDHFNIYDKDGKKVDYSHKTNILDGSLSCMIFYKDSDAELGSIDLSDLNELKKGLEIMGKGGEDMPLRHFAAFIDQQDDAETADVWLQCVLFGEIIYG